MRQNGHEPPTGTRVGVGLQPAGTLERRRSAEDSTLFPELQDEFPLVLCYVDAGLQQVDLSSKQYAAFEVSARPAHEQFEIILSQTLREDMKTLCRQYATALAQT